MKVQLLPHVFFHLSGDNVAQAMNIYGATRIGHGYRSIGTEAAGKCCRISVWDSMGQTRVGLRSRATECLVFFQIFWDYYIYIYIYIYIFIYIYIYNKVNHAMVEPPIWGHCSGEALSSAKAKGVHFELCPTSSVSTEAIELPSKDGALSSLLAI